MWGIQPWDNDRAADWFALLLNTTTLPTLVRPTLQLAQTDALDAEHIPLLRAAAYCLLQFGHVYVWPVEDLTSDLALAIRALQLVAQDEAYCYSEEVRSVVEAERHSLQVRLDSLVSRL